MYILFLKDGQGNENAVQVDQQFFEEYLLTEAHSEYTCKSQLLHMDIIHDDTDEPTIIETWKTKYFIHGIHVGTKFNFKNKCD